jgi:hypothetical protein
MTKSELIVDLRGQAIETNDFWDAVVAHVRLVDRKWLVGHLNGHGEQP